MTWRDEFQPGSFRGAAFRTEGHERSGGRRIAHFEFPGRDDPMVEDLGRRQRQFSIDCHVVGADYRAARNALIDALEAAGPGLLVHPWHGQVMVVVNDFTSSESTDEGGICRFQITFAEAGQAVAAPVAIPAGQLAAVEADAQLAAAPAAFATRFSLAGVQAFVEEGARKIIAGMVEISALTAGQQGGIGPTLRAFDAGLRYLPANMSSLLRAPINLGLAVVGLVGAVALLGNGSRSRIAALSRLVDWTPAGTVPAATTPSRQREADNRAALLWLFHCAAGAELARVAATATFTSYEDAIATRDAVAERLDALALAAADRGDDAAAEEFDRLRRAVVRDVTNRGATLARITTLELAATQPALSIANRIYGAAGVAARADEIVARNRLAHPGFVPAGRSLQLLTAQPAAGAT